MKKKILLIAVIVAFAACGPKRLGCGPRSCSVDREDLKTKKILQLQDFSFRIVVA